MFYYVDMTDYMGNTQRHIMQRLDDGGVRSFPLTDDNPNTTAYLAWVAEGNTAEEWEGM
jgi:hypothetical protein